MVLATQVFPLDIPPKNPYNITHRIHYLNGTFMPSRRKSRVVAMQMLYQIHLNAEPVQLVIKQFWHNRDTPAVNRQFTQQLVEGTTTNLEAIDAELKATSNNWKLHRMPIVDLSILRLATYEILYIDEIDAATSINEAIEIAKSYSTQNSPKFINGILDNIRKRNEIDISESN